MTGRWPPRSRAIHRVEPLELVMPPTPPVAVSVGAPLAPLLMEMRDHAPDDCRESMIENVPLHRDIAAAWEAR